MSGIAAFRQKLEADAAAAAAKGATPTLMPVNEKKNLREWKRNGSSTSINNGLGQGQHGTTTLLSPSGRKFGSGSGTKEQAKHLNLQPPMSPEPTRKPNPPVPSSAPAAATSKSRTIPSKTSSGNIAIPSTPSEAKKKLGSAAVHTPQGRKFTSSVKQSAPLTPPFASGGSSKPTVGGQQQQKQKQGDGGRASFSFAMAKPSEIRAAMRKEKGTTTQESTQSNKGDKKRHTTKARVPEPPSPVRGPKDEDDELMAIVRESNHRNSKKESVMTQMAQSFVHLDLHDTESNGKVSSSNGSNKGGREAPMIRKVTQSNSGRFRRMGSKRSLNGDSTVPSNLVPEMRRRAAPQDLMLAGDEHLNGKASVVGSGGLGKIKECSASVGSSGATTSDKNKKGGNDEIVLDAKQHHKKLQEEVVALRRREHEDKLEEARKFFQLGHDLCWQENDSWGALAKYRKALYIRESLLGKYHEDTGRTYYWIGRSLIKLRDYEEALVAFSRALRIFERTLFTKHKYNKWASGSIDTCFKEMGVSDDARDEYKEQLNASIQYERHGDSLRKQGKFGDAIVEYRNGIDTIEEYHPDAADLYCKVAMIFRTQGEFDRALEEYRHASKIYELSLGAEHPDTVKTLNQLIEKKRMNQLSLALQEKLDLNRP